MPSGIRNQTQRISASPSFKLPIAFAVEKCISSFQKRHDGSARVPKDGPHLFLGLACVCLSVGLSVCLFVLFCFVCLFVFCLFVCLSVCLFVWFVWFVWFVCLFVSVRLSVYSLNVCLRVCVPACLHACVPACASAACRNKRKRLL